MACGSLGQVALHHTASQHSQPDCLAVPWQLGLLLDKHPTAACCTITWG